MHTFVLTWKITGICGWPLHTCGSCAWRFLASVSIPVNDDLNYNVLYRDKGNYSLFCGLSFQDGILIWPWEVVKTFRKAALCLHLVNFFFNLFSSSWSTICKWLKYLIQCLLFIVVLNAHGVFLFSETLSFLWCSLCVVLFCVQICSYSVKYCHMYTKVFYSLTKGLIFNVFAGVVLILPHSFHPWFTNFPLFCCMIMYGLSLQHDLRIKWAFHSINLFWK